MTMATIAHCTECGGFLPDYWPRGLCPQCALTGALEETAAATGAADQLAGAMAGRDRTGVTRFGDYELLEEVARGGMGVVYRARQVSLNRIVALKMILAGQFASKQEIIRFRGEAEAAAHLQHPNIVRIHETGERDGHHYFSMDYVQGRTLADIVSDGPLPAQRAAKYARGIAEAIGHAHGQGVLHRDLKPSNVIIDANDEPRITDFGLAKRMRDDFGVTVTGQVLGSPNFMPPEQTSAKLSKAGPAGDVYGTGAVLYHLLTGRPPFQAETIEQLLLSLRDSEPVSPRLLNPSVPRDLETICLKCLEKEPARRYPTARALFEELNRFLRAEPIISRPLPAVARLWRWCRRRPLVAALSASVFLLLAAVAVTSTVAAWRVNRARAAEEEANRDLRQSISMLELERAEDFFSANDSAAGVAYLATLLRHNPTNSIAAHRLVSALLHRRWAVPGTAPLSHANRVTSARFSPNGTQVLTASWDHTAGVWERATGRLLAGLRHGNRVTCAVYSPDGGRILTASRSGTAQIWDAKTFGPTSPRLRHAGRINDAEFSADGRLVVTGSDDRTARIWDAVTGELRRELHGHSSPVILVRFNPDGRSVVTGGMLGSIRLWDVASGEMLRRVEDRRQPLTALSFSPDGQRLVVACEDGIVRLWNTANGESLGEPLVHRKPVWHAVFSPDNAWLLTGCEDGVARLWDTRTLRLAEEQLRHESGVIFGEFSPDSRSVVTTSSDNAARVWDMQSGAQLCQPLRHVERILHASFSRDGRGLVTASYDGVAQVWEMHDPLEPATQVQHDRHVAPLAFSPDGRVLLTAARDKTACLWDPQNGAAVSMMLQHDCTLSSGDVARDNRLVTLGCYDGGVRIWNCSGVPAISGVITNARVVAAFKAHEKAVYSVHFDVTGSKLVTASSDGTARVWDATTGQAVTPPLTHSAAVLTAHFSPDGRMVVTASEDRTARIWDATSGRPVTEPLVHIDHVRWAEFSPDGTRVVTASTDNTARIWDVRTGLPCAPPLHHARIVHGAVFSPDSRRIATASVDHTARIWDAATGLALTPALRHDRSVDRVYFNADGRHVITVCRFGSTRVWDSLTGRPLTEWLHAGNFWITHFDPVTERIAFGKSNGVAPILQMPQVPVPVPGWFPGFAEAVAGIRLGDRGHVELVSRQPAQELLREIPSGGRAGYFERIAIRFAGPLDASRAAAARTQ